MKSVLLSRCISIGIIGMLFMSFNVTAQEIIWGGPDDPNSTFDGGFNDWETIGVFCGGDADSTNAAWQWGIAPRSQGAYIGTTVLPFASPTASNGAAYFDSDYLDNNGIVNNLGTGTCPGPHRGELISPVIDLTNHDRIAVQFYQFYRRYEGPGNSQVIPATFLEVSDDGGETWTAIQLNKSLQVNSSTSNPSKLMINVSEWAANNPDFRFKFVFEGGYYFWMVDDVSLITLPEVDFTATRFRYKAKNITQSRYTVKSDTLDFALEIENNGADIDLELSVKIVNNITGEIIHSQKTDLFIPTLSTKGKYFPEKWNPDNLWEGNYTIIYEAKDKLDREDYSADDNIKTFPLNITTCNTINGDSSNGGILLADVNGQWGYGAHFYGPFNDKDQYTDYFVLGEVTTSFYSWGNSTLDGKKAKFYVLELGPDWYRNNTTSIENSPESVFKIIGYGEMNLSQSMNGIQVTPELESTVEDDSPYHIKIKANKEYMVIALVPDSVQVGAMRNYPSYDMQYDEDNNPIYTSLVLVHSSRIYNGDHFSGNFPIASSYWDIKIYHPYSSDCIVNNLPKIKTNKFKVYPNPSMTGFINVELDFEREIQTNIYITDINGVLLNISTTNVTKGIYKIDTTALTPGVYMVILSNEYGVATEKILIIN